MTRKPLSKKEKTTLMRLILRMNPLEFVNFVEDEVWLEVLPEDIKDRVLTRLNYYTGVTK